MRKKLFSGGMKEEAVFRDFQSFLDRPNATSLAPAAGRRVSCVNHVPDPGSLEIAQGPTTVD